MIQRLLIACIAVAANLFPLPFTASAADNWVEVKSAHFTISTNSGVKEAQKIADQFEQIRLMFHTQFSTLKVDPPQPIYIIAAKNEGTLKLYLPEEWEVKGHIHHAGMYQPALDKDYVIMRLDTEGKNPFHVLYHEYTHALVRLNFTNLPLWLNEGLADFYGNTTLGDREIRTGSIDDSHLYILGQNKLIPIETLLQVDHKSPYYNETNQANVFYAESWALVHYLMMDPEARQKQLMKVFLDSYTKSGDQIVAAKEAFGDLKLFGKKIDSYAQQRTFMVAVIKIAQDKSDKNYATRPLTPGEILAIRGDFFTHHNRVEQAAPILDESLKEEPNLPAAHFAKGYYYYRKFDQKDAEAEMAEAIKFGAADFAPFYFDGVMMQQNGSGSDQDMVNARKNLQKSIQLNPIFAPAYEALSHTYSHNAEDQKLAVTAALKAVQLDPGVLHYSVNLAYLLINNGRNAEAQIMIDRIRKVSDSDSEKFLATNLQQNLDQRKTWEAKKQAAPQIAVGQNGEIETTTRIEIENELPRSTVPAAQGYSPEKQGQTYAADGEVSDADCSKKPELTINLQLKNGPVTFHSRDFGKLTLTHADGVPEPSLKSCETWKGRQVKVWFSATPGRMYAGEITKLFFY